MRLLYLCLGHCLAPIAFLRECWRALRVPAQRHGLGGRFGFGDYRAPGAVWVHAVSVGEVQAAAPLLQQMRTVATAGLVVTASTATGYARARALYGSFADVRYLPYDLPGSVGRFLDRIRPSVGVVLETELWPTLYRACGRRGIALVIASARLSERSVRRYGRMPAFVGSVIGADHVRVAAQTEADARRFLALGASPSRTTVCGNLKFDRPADTALALAAAQRRAALGSARLVWVAGSTHEGEESQVLAAHRKIRAEVPDALLVLAPRHPPRFEAVAQQLQRDGWVLQKRSRGEHVEPGTDVLLLDTLGELVAYDAAADVAFVGGSLVPIGGHNLLEPLSVGRPALTGPFNGNDPATARLLTEAGAVRQVADASALAEAVCELWRRPDQAAAMAAAGRAMLERNAGAVRRLLVVIAAACPAAVTTEAISGS